MTRMKDGKLKFPMQAPSASGTHVYFAFDDDFSEFLAKNIGDSDLNDEQVAAATKGILGMMRFANHENPLLLEALGDLLMLQRSRDAARNLAARPYLRASYLVQDSQAQQAYRELAKSALITQTPGPLSLDNVSLEQVEADFKRELADAADWYTELEKREHGWIAQNEDVEVNFDRLYNQEPAALATSKTVVSRAIGSRPFIAGLLVLSVVAVSFLWWRRSRRKVMLAAKGIQP